MSQKHKLTNTVKAEIRIAIADLPVMYKLNVYKRAVVSGRKLIKEGVKEVRGESVKEDGKYIRNERVRVDHYNRAQEEYRAGGVTALTAYVVHVLSTVKNEEKDSVASN